MTILSRTALTAALLLAPVAALAAPIAGGNTVVRVLVPLAPAVPGVLGTASVLSASPLDLNFPITGGTIDFVGPNGIETIAQHNGSGFSISFGALVATAEDLVVDTFANTVSGLLTIGGTSFGVLPLFVFDPSGVTAAQFQDLANPLLQLDVSPQVRTLAGQFGVSITDPQRFGTIAVGARPLVEVPAPAALALFGLGLVGLAFRRR